METIKDEEYEMIIDLRDFMRKIAENKRMKWGEFLRVFYACGIDISAKNYATDFDQCKEAMRIMLERYLTIAEEVYGTKSKD